MKCPYCAEDVQPEARKCKHCGEWLEKEAAPPSPGATGYAIGKILRSGILIVVIVVFAILIIPWVVEFAKNFFTAPIGFK